MAESEEELKSLLMKVKEESGKAGLNSTFQSHHIMANRWGTNGNSGRFYFPGLRNDYSHEIKGQLLLERKATTNLVFTLGHFSHVQLCVTP